MQEHDFDPPKGRRKYKTYKRRGLLKLLVLGGSIFVVLFFVAIFILSAFF